MVPDSYVAYFTGTATAAGALIGLLFVAITLRPEAVGADHGVAHGVLLAGSAFTALVNGFFVSLVALVPDTDLGTGAAILGGLSLAWTARLHLTSRSTESNWVLFSASICAYLAQVGVGIALNLHQHRTGLVEAVAYLVMGSLSVALARAWSLIQGRHLEGIGPDTDRGGPDAA